MNELVDVVNRLRSKGYSYEKIVEMLVKMGNPKERSDKAIEEYVRGILE